MPAEEPSNATPGSPVDPLRTADAVPRVRVSGPAEASTHSGSTWKHAEDVGPTSDPSTRYEHFEILRREDGFPWRLGRGAMGATYKALDTRLHHHVALKVISGDLTGYPAARERFLREARTAARLHHPNVARIFHLGETGGGSEAFYAMEFVEGETLEARVRRTGPLSVWLTLEVGIQVARALMAACQQDLIHRDLKPANLMLVTAVEAATLAVVGSGSSHGEIGEAWVKVIDFGLAKAVADAGPLTGVGDFIGTPAYASPEQFSSDARSVDGRSDIYSLGATLWYALTGKMPFEGNSFTEIERQKRSQEVRPAQLAAAAVPVPLARLLTSMLAADPGDRPQTPSVLLEAFRRCREELRRLTPHGADRSPTLSLLWTPLRRFRHRRIYQVFFGYAVGLLALLRNEGGSVGVSISQTLQERREYFHALRLNEGLDGFNPAVNTFLTQAKAPFLQAGGDPVAAGQMALQSLENLRAQQASGLAYFDAFFVFGVVGAGLAFGVLFMRRSVIEKGAHIAAE